jgi:hypothetical protein
LDKKTRTEFLNEFEPFSWKYKCSKLDIKVCLFLASKGVVFPIKLREYGKKIVKSLIIKEINV